MRNEQNLADTGIEKPKVMILLATYQGQKYLADQLRSFSNQIYPNWQVWASDDGSSDDTQAILFRFKKTWPIGKLILDKGAQAGFSANFLKMTCNKKIRADFYSYADQDDIWEPHKLNHAISWLQTIPDDVPALYCSRTRLVDSHDRPLGLSPKFIKPPSFSNSLLQNIAGGNTMVFNNAARKLLIRAGATVPVVSHDWWTYMLVSGCGGRIFYDLTPTVRYRQHQNNLVGMNSSFAARYLRMKMMWRGNFKEWGDINIAALFSVFPMLTDHNQAILTKFSEARKAPLRQRLIGLKKSGVYRQSRLSTFVFALAAMIGKV